MEEGKGSIWLACQQGLEKEAEANLCAAFTAAGIADQLLDVITLPDSLHSTGPVSLSKHSLQFSSLFLVKADRTEQAAAILRSGWEKANWHIAKLPVKGRQPEQAPQEYAFKHREKVRVTAWPLAGFPGQVIWIDKKTDQVLVNIMQFGALANVVLHPSCLEKEEST